ncbi:hypothetical protein WICPIJ_000201 [Wickerhamomyces pijperi]|uniref:Ergosterol biosynthesis protein n=1 Tax=Wickerhamomyces pijperi TaxID=599730 RepID=A0A9P8QD32_WICPI|nr:hypothetical protein WICPIJ_000201 [Wickerhamomyces pijperi]
MEESKSSESSGFNLIRWERLALMFEGLSLLKRSSEASYDWSDCRIYSIIISDNSPMISLVGLIPQTPGILPKWLLFISLVSILNSFQTYTNLSLTKKVYSNTNEVTPLSARTFGTWTLISSVIRFYAAYYLTNPQIYQITLASYIIAFLHFGSEWVWFKTTKLDSGLYGPLIVSTLTITWMISQYDYYVKI